METLGDAFLVAQQWLYESAVQPLAFALGLGNLLEDAYDATGWLLVGVLQLLVLLLVIAPLQRWRPVEPVTDRSTIRTDILYTLIHRLGLFKLAMFFSLDPVMDEIFGSARVAGIGTFHLDALWPGVTDQPLASLVLYLVVFDFINYWIHRGQHQFHWWWKLHALHHAQRQMTMWSDNRNHLLDDMLRDALMVVAAQLIGVAPGQFVAIVALTQLSESFQHANVRLWFGSIGERLWISPRFHRRHHTIGIGHESTPRDAPEGLTAAAPGLPAQARTDGSGAASRGDTSREPHAVGERGGEIMGGHNFGVLLPWWDMLFGTADFKLRFDPTGVRDQVEQGRDYGQGFWSQQWRGLLRLFGRA